MFRVLNREFCCFKTHQNAFGAVLCTDRRRELTALPKLPSGMKGNNMEEVGDEKGRSDRKGERVVREGSGARWKFESYCKIRYE